MPIIQITLTAPATGKTNSSTPKTIESRPPRIRMVISKFLTSMSWSNRRSRTISSARRSSRAPEIVHPGGLSIRSVPCIGWSVFRRIRSANDALVDAPSRPPDSLLRHRPVLPEEPLHDPPPFPPAGSGAF